MENFISKHKNAIKGVISCFDRMIFKGHLPINYPEAMSFFLYNHKILLKDFNSFVAEQTLILKKHAIDIAAKTKRPFHYVNHYMRKEEFVQEIIKRDKISEGLVCIIAAVEACNSFRIVPGKDRPKIEAASRKCYCLYFYYIDRIFGLMYIRLQTWFPFMIQVYINGHEWLARKMDMHKIAYNQADNCFVDVSDFERAQKFSDKFIHIKWQRIFDAFARRTNPLMKTILSDLQYRWVVEQAEYSTDVVFRDPSYLASLYKELLPHSILCHSSKDVLTFLGRKANGNFKGEVMSDFKDRFQGTRVKHQMNNNWIKMYNKAWCVLRIETVINRPKCFKVLRWGKCHGKRIYSWFTMSKKISHLNRYAEISTVANRNYLDSLAVVNDLSGTMNHVDAVCRPFKKNGRSIRALNPLSCKDTDIFSAVLHGEHLINGFRNKDIRRILFQHTGKSEELKNASKVSRILKCLHSHGLVVKIQRSRRWKVTDLGHLLMSNAILLRTKYLPQYMTASA